MIGIEVVHRLGIECVEPVINGLTYTDLYAQLLMGDTVYTCFSQSCQKMILFWT
jgi:hypothetical protein